jgi:hypothetical protein
MQNAWLQLNCPIGPCDRLRPQQTAAVQSQTSVKRKPRRPPSVPGRSRHGEAVRNIPCIRSNVRPTAARTRRDSNSGSSCAAASTAAPRFGGRPTLWDREAVVSGACTAGAGLTRSDIDRVAGSCRAVRPSVAAMDACVRSVTPCADAQPPPATSAAAVAVINAYFMISPYWLWCGSTFQQQRNDIAALKFRDRTLFC